MICISIVSHGHAKMVEILIKQIVNLSLVEQIILTFNIPEQFQNIDDNRIKIIQNNKQVGFGANHNKAFKVCKQPYFCVLNPDVQLINDPFVILLKHLENNYISLIAPLVITKSGEIEDSARVFPTLLSIAKKILLSDEGRWNLDMEETINYPDWVAGMFMLFKSDKFAKISGFNEKFFLYYEDVDICRRFKIAGYKIGLCTEINIIHIARRDSRKKLKYLFFHLKSLIQFFLTRYK